MTVGNYYGFYVSTQKQEYFSAFIIQHEASNICIVNWWKVINIILIM